MLFTRGVGALLHLFSNGVGPGFHPSTFGKFEHGAEVFSHINEVGFGFTEGKCNVCLQVGHKIPEPRGCVGNVAKATCKRCHVKDEPAVPVGMPSGCDDAHSTSDILDGRADSERPGIDLNP